MNTPQKYNVSAGIFFSGQYLKKTQETGNHQVLGNQKLLNLIFSVKN